MQNKILEFIGHYNTAPFLFVGSGFSRRYLGLDDWEGLLKRFATLNKVDYQYYYASSGGKLPLIATMIAEDLHEKWWKLPEFEKSRNKYKEICTNKYSALKIEISHYLKSKMDFTIQDKILLEELDLCKKVVIDGIITTNYDNLLEKIFSDFKTYIGQEELFFSSPQGIGEIYKIHGCQSKPNSLILTEEDYISFEEKNPYLAAKLLTIFTEHPIIFIGYSLTDENILKILNSIAKCLTSQNLQKLKNRLIFIQYKPDQTELDFSTHTIAHEEIRIPVKTITMSDFRPLFHALSSIKRKFPAGLLRLLREHVYELVMTTESSSKLYVQNIDSKEDVKNLDVVLGIGAINRVIKAGYRRYERKDLIEDLLVTDKTLNNNEIVKITLPALLKGTKYLPFFKYVMNTDYHTQDGFSTEVDERVINHYNLALQESFYKPTGKYEKMKGGEFESYAKSMTEFINEYGLEYIKYIPYLRSDKINSTELFEILIKHLSVLEGNNDNLKNNFYKIICYYDFIKYFKKQ